MVKLDAAQVKTKEPKQQLKIAVDKIKAFQS